MHTHFLVALPADLYDPILASALHLLAPPRFPTDTSRLTPTLTLMAVAPRALAPATTLVALTRQFWFIGPDEITGAYASHEHDSSTPAGLWLLNHIVRMSKWGRTWPRTMDFSLAGVTSAAGHGNLMLVQWWLGDDAQLLEGVIRWTVDQVDAAASDAEAAAAAVKRSGLEDVRHAASRNGQFHVLAWWLTQKRLPVVDVEPDLVVLVASGKLDFDSELRALFDRLMDQFDLVPNGVIEAACRANTVGSIESLVEEAIPAKILEWEHVGFRPMDACTSVQGLQWWADHTTHDQLVYLYSDRAVQNCTDSSLLDWWVENSDKLGLPFRFSIKSALSTAAVHGRLDVLNWWVRSRDPSLFDPFSWASLVSAGIDLGKDQVFRWCFEPLVLHKFGVNTAEAKVDIVIGDCRALTPAVLESLSTLLSQGNCVRFSISFNCKALADVSSAGHVDVLDKIVGLSRAFPTFVAYHFDSSAMEGASESGHTGVLDWWSCHHPDQVPLALATSLQAASRSGKTESLQWWCTHHISSKAGEVLTDTLILECVTEACAYDHGNVLCWWLETLIDLHVSTDSMQFAAVAHCHTLVGAHPSCAVRAVEYVRWLFSWLPRTSHITSMVGMAAYRLKNHQVQDLFWRQIGAGDQIGRCRLDPDDELRPGYRWWVEHSTTGLVRTDLGTTY